MTIGSTDRSPSQDTKMDSPGTHTGVKRSPAVYIAVGCLAAVVMGSLALVGFYYVVFGDGSDTTVYPKDYSESKFESIQKGITEWEVRSILGEPFSKSQEIVFTRELPQNSCDTHYCSFENGRQVLGSVLLDARSGGRRVSSMEEAMALLTPEERKVAVIQHDWSYAKTAPIPLLSQHHQFRHVTFDTRGIVVDKFAGEWVD